MNSNGFNASTTGVQKIFAISMIMALLVASFAATSVFAAPVRQDGGGGEDGSGGVTPNQVRELQQSQAWFNNFRTKPGRGNSARISQYLGQYAFALGQANAILVGGASSNAQGNNANSQGDNANGQSNNTQTNNAQSGNNFSAQQNIGMWLKMMRGLRQKIAVEGNQSANNSSNSNNNAGAGIPVTGGSTNNDQSPTPNNQGSAQNNGNNAGTTNNNQGSSLSQTWGPQLRELQQAQTWFNNFRTQPGRGQNSARVSQYLDQYAFALGQSYVIIAGGINANSLNNGDNSNTFDQGLANSQSDRTAAQQQLAQYLHMMRGLRQKISTGGADNNNDTNN